MSNCPSSSSHSPKPRVLTELLLLLKLDKDSLRRYLVSPTHSALLGLSPAPKTPSSSSLGHLTVPSATTPAVPTATYKHGGTAAAGDATGAGGCSAEHCSSRTAAEATQTRRKGERGPRASREPLPSRGAPGEGRRAPPEAAVDLGSQTPRGRDAERGGARRGPTGRAGWTRLPHTCKLKTWTGSGILPHAAASGRPPLHAPLPFPGRASRPGCGRQVKLLKGPRPRSAPRRRRRDDVRALPPRGRRHLPECGAMRWPRSAAGAGGAAT